MPREDEEREVKINNRILGECRCVATGTYNVIMAYVQMCVILL
jgi:hypothetical protein